MPRILGGVSVPSIQSNLISTAWFVKLEIPAGNFVYYTDKPTGDYADPSHLISGTDDSGSVTWVGYDIKVGSIVQNQTSPLDVSYVEFENLDNTWSAYLLNTGTRFRNVQIYYGWFDPVTDALLGSMKMFDGKTDEATIGTRIHIALVPHRTPWNALLPARRYLPTCQYLYRDADTCQYAALATPSGLAASQIGGTIGAGTYYWQITALGMGGETLGSNEVSLVFLSAHGADLTWPAVPFAKSYNVYGRVTGGTKALIANVTAPVYNDVSTTGLGATLPSSNTTGALPSCARTQGDCKTHQNDTHFGGFVRLQGPSFKLVWGSIVTIVPDANQSFTVPQVDATPPPNDRAELIRPTPRDRGTRTSGPRAG
jgi:hypothetical protein